MPRPSSKSSPNGSPPIDAEYRELTPQEKATSPDRSPVRLRVRRVRAATAVPARARPHPASATEPGACPFCGKPGELGDVRLPLGVSVKACQKCGAIGNFAVRAFGALLR